MNVRLLLPLILVGALLSGAAGNVRAAASGPPDPVRAAAESLGSTRPPWYNPSEDALRPLPPENVGDVAKYRHVTGSRAVTVKEKKHQDRTAQPQTVGPVTKFLTPFGWFLAALLMSVFVGGLVWAYRRGERQKLRSAPETRVELADVTARFEKLPVALDPESPDLLEEARRCYEAGDYRRATVLLFSYQLLVLDQKQLVRLAKGKTNRQYLYELRHHRDIRPLFETTMIAFEDVYFGRRMPDREQLAVVWQQLDAFHRALEPAPR